MSYSEQVRDLAELFLKDQDAPYQPSDVASLAQTIQDAAEGWLQDWESRQ